ncbi:MAG: Fe-S cluster assembly protein SufB [Nanoarchaeota archaeon]|nr:Fe-S cluster assembly protein SufB [Nanoarchaeota archaeon]|tara:strand:- start:1919 stop:3331 length:1413 start_codon:yes stop_codon:yes gene_type:complete
MQSQTEQLENFTIDRNRYDDANEDKSVYKSEPGLTEEVVRKISESKSEPEWMLQKRLQAFKLFQETPMPNWGPSLKNLDLEKIHFFIQPGVKETRNWDDVPEDIKKTFERIGVPEAERRSLAGTGAQYDSEMVYHNLKKEWEEKGVIFENMDVAVQKYPELVKQYFMTQCIPITDHKFIMLHAAVWSGGTFIYVPKNVKVDIPLQAYFRMNAMRGGQFEHTLIILEENSELHYIEGCSAPLFTESALHAGCVEIFVKENATMKYSSIENWSKNVFNLNTKRGLVDKNATLSWISGNMGSGTTMLYPCSILRGEGASTDNLGIAFAGKNQHQDVGAKAIHAAPFTNSKITSKSISKDGGVSSYRGLVKIMPHAHGCTTSVVCDALILDDQSKSNTIPELKIENNDVDAAHEAKVGKISEEAIFYLQSRGLSEEQAMQMIVTGFIEPIIRELPLEHAIELNKLIEMELEGVA